MTKNPKIVFLIASFSYFSLTFLLFFPLFKHPSEILFGLGGDSFGLVNQLWRNTRGFSNSEMNPLICAPFGLTPPFRSIQPLYELFLSSSARLFGDIAGYNFLVLISFPLTATATFLFLQYMTRHSVASWIGGFSFGFSPFSIMHASVGHLTFSLNFCLPLFLWSLFYHREKHCLVSSALLGITYSALLLLSTYWGYFCFFLGLLFFVLDVTTYSAGPRGSVTRSYILAILSALGVLTLFLFPFLQAMLRKSGGVSDGVIYVRNFTELKMYAAYPWEYFMPSIHHPLWGKWVHSIFKIFLHASNIVEQSFYLGSFSILTCLLGWRLATNAGMMQAHKKLFFILGSMIVFMLLMSFPPYFPIGELKIPNISYFLFQIFPLFRVYARASALVHLLLIVCAAIFFTQIESKYGFLKNPILRSFLLLFVVFDMWSISPVFFTKINPPEIYRWLGQQTGQGLVAEYPMTPGDSMVYYRYLFWQRLHGKPLVNGAMPYHKQAWSFYNEISDLSKPGVKERLKEQGVRFVIVHQESYREGPILHSLKPYYPPIYSAEMYNKGKTPISDTWAPRLKKFGMDWVFEI